MKKLHMATVGLATAVGLSGLLWSDLSTAQQPVGQSPPTGQSPERFVVPVASPVPTPSTPAYLPTTPGFQRLPAPPQSAVDTTGANKTSFLTEILNNPQFDEPDINQDIAVQPRCGNWMICVNWYSGSDAAKEAREMALELRNNPDYHLAAYVFTKGAEERKAELNRIRQEMLDQQAKLKEKAPKLVPGTRMQVSIVKSRLEIQCAVLVGGYPDMESASRHLDQLRRLNKLLDPNKVKIFSDYVVEVDEKGKPKEAKATLVNPFTRALPVPNPSIQADRNSHLNVEDIGMLRQFNAKEEYSLLKCPKRYTLVVKQYSLNVYLQQSNASPSFLEKLGLTKPPDSTDRAGFNAHSLADLLHQDKWESYVLHMKHASYVTVGSYDSVDDPRIARDQERVAQYNSKMQSINPQNFATVRLLPRPVIMEVPKQ